MDKMILIALISGLLFGTLFFGGLWITVRKTLGSPNPAIWILGSSLLRTAIVLIGFYYIVQEGLQALLISLVGFIIARFIVMRATKSFEQKRIHPSNTDQS
jgi:F1F0 ATPase subunit 2